MGDDEVERSSFGKQTRLRSPLRKTSAIGRVLTSHDHSLSVHVNARHHPERIAMRHHIADRWDDGQIPHVSVLSETEGHLLLQTITLRKDGAQTPGRQTGSGDQIV